MKEHPGTGTAGAQTRNARAADPETSHLAAAAQRPSDVATVGEFLRDNDRRQGWTRAELASALGWDEYRTSKRQSDAVRDGWATQATGPDGVPIKRCGNTGRKQIAVRAAAAVQEAAEK